MHITMCQGGIDMDNNTENLYSLDQAIDLKYEKVVKITGICVNSG